jgi:hypothetical protein
MNNNNYGCTKLYALNYDSSDIKHDETLCDYGPFGKDVRLNLFLLQDTINNLKSYSDIEKQIDNTVFSILKEKCYIDIITILKSIIPYLQIFINKALDTKNIKEAKILINTNETYDLIKKIVSNIINIQKTQVKCFFDNMKGSAGDELRKQLISNSMTFNYSLDDDYLKKYEKETSKIFYNLQKGITSIINTIITFAEIGGYDKNKLEQIKKIKDELLIKFVENKFINTNNELICYSNIEKIKHIINNEFNENLKENVNILQNNCNNKCDNKIDIVKKKIDDKINKKCNILTKQYKIKIEKTLLENENKIYDAELLKKKSISSREFKKKTSILCAVLFVLILISWLFLPNYLKKKGKK